MLGKNINTFAMLTRDTLLHHFRKGIHHGEDRWLHTLIFYVLLVVYTTTCSVLKGEL